jgi:hypothetical protein
MDKMTAYSISRLMDKLDHEKGLSRELEEQLVALVQAIEKVCSEEQKDQILRIIEKK